MKSKHRYLAFTFGPIGDTLMMLALFDDILKIDPEAKFLIISRRNIGLIRDLAQKYPSVEVRQIPEGVKAISFFASLLSKQWILLALGVAGAYSTRIKLFFLSLSLLPGNLTLGFNDKGPGQKGWLPLDHVFQFDGSIYMIENFRRLLDPIFDKKQTEAIRGQAPTVALETRLPKDFSLETGTYIATNFFSVSSLRSLPLRRWVALVPKIRKEFSEYPIVLLGGPADEEAVQKVAAGDPQVLPMAGLPLPEAAGIIDNAAVYIGVDTGITHLSGVLKQKSLVVSHFRFPTWRPTYNPNARAIANSLNCECLQGGSCEVVEDGARYSRCMHDVSDEFILESLRLALSSPSRSVPGFAGFVDEQRREDNRKSSGE